MPKTNTCIPNYHKTKLSSFLHFFSNEDQRIGGKREFPHFDGTIMFSNSVTKQMKKLYISAENKLKTETLKSLIGSH